MKIDIDLISQKLPHFTKNEIKQLLSIWEEVVDNIITTILTKAKNKHEPLHHNLKEEQIFELAKLTLWTRKEIIHGRIKYIQSKSFTVDNELAFHYSDLGKVYIEDTASILFNRIWDKIYKTCWLPKTIKALEKEKNPNLKKTKKPQIKKVKRNHFIPKFMIKNYWSKNETILIGEKQNLTSKKMNYGLFGYSNNLYTNQLEYYFGLIEGDAKIPLEKLINIIPINRPEKEALIGLVIINFLRNPFGYKKKVEKLFEDYITNNTNVDKDTHIETIIKKGFQTVFNNNEFYGKLTKNILVNRTILVKNNEELFILPDTGVFYKKTLKGQIIFFPISPKYILVFLDKLDQRSKKEQIIPENIILDNKQSINFSRFLIRNCHKNFLHTEQFMLNLKRVRKDKPIELSEILSIFK